jgi:hypothetical protein
MKVEIHSITIKASVEHDDREERIERTFARTDLPHAAGWIRDIDILSKKLEMKGKLGS